MLLYLVRETNALLLHMYQSIICSSDCEVCMKGLYGELMFNSAVYFSILEIPMLGLRSFATLILQLISFNIASIAPCSKR